MKLTIQNTKVIFNFTNINTSSLITNPDYIKAAQAREFLQTTACEWEPTENPQVFKMVYELVAWATDYGNAKRFRFYLSNCKAKAMYLKYIEITPEFEALLAETEKRCDVLREIEIAKEKEFELKAKWESVCKFGCGSCKNLCYDLDTPVCKCSGDELEERHKPQFRGNTVHLFNLIPFPSQNCAFNASKGVL